MKSQICSGEIKFCGQSINNLVQWFFYCALKTFSKYSSVNFVVLVRLFVRIEQLDGSTWSSWNIDSELPESVVTSYNLKKQLCRNTYTHIWMHL
jgi:hypothetical protein